MEAGGNVEWCGFSPPVSVDLIFSMSRRHIDLALLPNKKYSPIGLYKVAFDSLGAHRCHIMTLQWFRKDNILRCCYKDLSTQKDKTRRFHSVSDGYFVRNDKLYCSTPFWYKNWLTSLDMFLFSTGDILVHELVHSSPAYLRLRAFICMFAAPLVSFAGLLMPFISRYFNSVVGDLDCWMNDFDNRTITHFVPQERNLDRCFAIDLQPYTYVGAHCDRFGVHVTRKWFGLPKSTLLKICDKHADILHSSFSLPFTGGLLSYLRSLLKEA